jgi:hypothetical protein
MARTTYERQINRWARCDREFFEELFKELSLCNFDDVRVLVPSNEPDERERSFAPSTFLDFEEPIRGVVVYAKNTEKSDTLEILWAYKDPSQMFPFANWPKRRFGMGMVRVVSYDAPRPYALSGHFATFCRERSSGFFFEHPAWGLLNLAGLAMYVAPMIAERRVSWTNIALTGLFVFGLWSSLTLRRGVHVGPLKREKKPTFFTDLNSGRYQFHPVLIIVYGVIVVLLSNIIWEAIKSYFAR